MKSDSSIYQPAQDSSIRLGLIASASEYSGTSPRLKGPVLEQMVEFDPGKYAKARRAVFDAFVIGGPQMPMILFALCIEDVLLNWLADPTEPEVWRAIDTWNRQGAVPVALSRGDTHTFVIPLLEKLGDPVNQLRRLNNKPATDAFVTQAIEVCKLGMLDGYEHPYAPAPAHRNSCVLHTRRVDRALKRLGYEIAYPSSGSGATVFHARRTELSAVPADARRAIRTVH
ncbi:hypothetical protein [Paraburkholderia saeva]|uniref:Uncharacterized protein n=1 Tax=Paraburkholderia saeva TaxID=2777537 RepID=A0A9N8RS80_9BURK|nr:hypothetical protein [Paraburkholderia saeva]CAG4886936.1 hypothetical protein LMG31841_00296 [Paraburkholderia saeva]CAG4887050.1 hypothetical protein R70241_00321 [Paraburkholderia saeva]